MQLHHDPQRVRYLRVAKGLSIADAAALAGISAPTWGRIERGTVITGPHTLSKVASALGVKITDLMPPLADNTWCPTPAEHDRLYRQSERTWRLTAAQRAMDTRDGTVCGWCGHALSRESA